MTLSSQSAMNKGEADIRLLTHMSTAGAIIGKGGAKIKDLREVGVLVLSSLLNVWVGGICTKGESAKCRPR